MEVSFSTWNRNFRRSAWANQRRFPLPHSPPRSSTQAEEFVSPPLRSVRPPSSLARGSAIKSNGFMQRLCCAIDGTFKHPLTLLARARAYACVCKEGEKDSLNSPFSILNNLEERMRFKFWPRGCLSFSSFAVIRTPPRQISRKLEKWWETAHLMESEVKLKIWLAEHLKGQPIWWNLKLSWKCDLQNI
jgi:hypothetical protein